MNSINNLASRRDGLRWVAARAGEIRSGAPSDGLLLAEADLLRFIAATDAQARELEPLILAASAESDREALSKIEVLAEAWKRKLPKAEDYDKAGIPRGAPVRTEELHAIVSKLVDLFQR